MIAPKPSSPTLILSPLKIGEPNFAFSVKVFLPILCNLTSPSILIQRAITSARSSNKRKNNIEINVNYEDDDILVINKNSGIVVHPAESVKKGTIANGLVFKYPKLVNLPRSGLIHRLDKDTSGLLTVSYTHLRAHET